MTAPEASAFLQGVAHFNRGEFFEAHEVWEVLWRETPGPSADLYKGLIQCAVALHHLRRGNLDGARRVYQRQRQYLSRFSPTTLGVPVADLLARMDALFAPLLAAAPGERADIDLARIPTIDLESSSTAPSMSADRTGESRGLRRPACGGSVS
jgi:uncharacterized protein